MTSEPAFLEPKQWTVESIGVKASVNVDDLRLLAAAQFGARLAAGCDALLRFRAIQQGVTLAEEIRTVSLIPPEPRIAVTVDQVLDLADAADLLELA